MCRKVAWCTELPVDPQDWDRRSPLTAKEWFPGAAFAFRSALVSAAAGDLDQARDELAGTRGAELQEWYIEHAQNIHRFRLKASGVVAPPKVVARDAVRYPKELYAGVMARDSWHCRYCGVPVVDRSAQKRLASLVGKESFPIGRTNLERHGVRLALTATMDHVEAHHAGGGSELDNLVTACWGCNYGKGRHGLVELLLDDPRDRAPVSSDWDGGSSLVAAARAPAHA